MNADNSQAKKSSGNGILMSGCTVFGSAIVTRLCNFQGRKQFVLPIVCASTCYVAWNSLISVPIKEDRLWCGVCAGLRGSSVTLFTNCVIPSFIGSTFNLKKGPFWLNSINFLDGMSKPLNIIQQPFTCSIIALLLCAGFLLAVDENDRNLLLKLKEKK